MDSGFGSAAAAAGLGSLVVGRETTAMWSSSCRLCGYHYAQRLSEHWCSHCLAAAAAAAGVVVVVVVLVVVEVVVVVVLRNSRHYKYDLAQ